MKEKAAIESQSQKNFVIIKYLLQYRKRGKSFFKGEGDGFFSTKMYCIEEDRWSSLNCYRGSHEHGTN
jgi:hypothetical protein